MKLIYTEEALRDLDEILTYLAINYPTVAAFFEKRLRAVTARIGEWPEGAQQVGGRPGVRAAPLIRYPYTVFYRATDAAVEILHIHHSARRHLREDEAGSHGRMEKADDE